MLMLVDRTVVSSVLSSVPSLAKIGNTMLYLNINTHITFFECSLCKHGGWLHFSGMLHGYIGAFITMNFP